LVFGITKPIALESILKKCTELGIASFQPLVTDHSLHPGSWNADRWNKVIVEACKQSQELWFPALAEPLTFSNWLSQRNALHSLIVCDENERTPSLTHPLKTPVEILIGPEGGWSVLERERLKSLNGTSLGLGKNRLRADTACLVALALTKNAVGEL
ncbi:RsmE family RNA methyltransferase, partial [bacterium]|nr:RsmE family RNA methyltransferase [bacterium]